MKLGIFTVIILLIKAIWSDELFKERAIYFIWNKSGSMFRNRGLGKQFKAFFYQVSEIQCVIPAYDILLKIR